METLEALTLRHAQELQALQDKINFISTLTVPPGTAVYLVHRSLYGYRHVSLKLADASTSDVSLKLADASTSDVSLKLADASTSDVSLKLADASTHPSQNATAHPSQNATTASTTPQLNPTPYPNPTTLPDALVDFIRDNAKPLHIYRGTFAGIYPERPDTPDWRNATQGSATGNTCITTDDVTSKETLVFYVGKTKFSLEVNTGLPNLRPFVSGRDFKGKPTK